MKDTLIITMLVAGIFFAGESVHRKVVERFRLDLPRGEYKVETAESTFDGLLLLVVPSQARNHLEKPRIIQVRAGEIPSSGYPPKTIRLGATGTVEVIKWSQNWGHQDHLSVRCSP